MKEEPVELQTGMVFALETYCPASDGFSAARIEEEEDSSHSRRSTLHASRCSLQELFMRQPVLNPNPC